jgi:hypothetical protein
MCSGPPRPQALNSVLIAAQLAGWTRLYLPVLLGTLVVEDPDHARASCFLAHLLAAVLYAAGFGGMNLCSRSVAAFDTEYIDNGSALSRSCAVALAAARNAENLERAVTTRTVIGQAEEILMERFKISADQAFAVLRRVPQDRNPKLNKLAEEVVTKTPGRSRTSCHTGRTRCRSLRETVGGGSVICTLPTKSTGHVPLTLATNRAPMLGVRRGC